MVLRFSAFLLVQVSVPGKPWPVWAIHTLLEDWWNRDWGGWGDGFTSARCHGPQILTCSTWCSWEEISAMLQQSFKSYIAVSKWISRWNYYWVRPLILFPPFLIATAGFLPIPSLSIWRTSGVISSQNHQMLASDWWYPLFRQCFLTLLPPTAKA